MNILITGGLGYIGSHIAVELVQQGHIVTIVDNLANSRRSTARSIELISRSSVRFIRCDVQNTTELEYILKLHEIQAVIHLAALKLATESIRHSIDYYENNVGGFISLLQAMKNAKIKHLLLNSSADVYGLTDTAIISGQIPHDQYKSPFAASMQMCEKILEDACRSTGLRATVLRSFNVAGAHPSGKIGELPSTTPTTLIPFIVQVAAGNRSVLTINGKNFDTTDGTAVREYTHVTDVANAHIKALQHVLISKQAFSVFNITSGRSISVLELVSLFERINNVHVPYVFGPRRPGDAGSVRSDNLAARKVLGWKPEHNLEQIVKDAWNRQLENSKVHFYPRTPSRSSTVSIIS